MAVNYGSKRIVVGAHYGLRDWLAQRVTAVLMALFTALVLAQLLLFNWDTNDSQCLNMIPQQKLGKKLVQLPVMIDKEQYGI